MLTIIIILIILFVGFVAFRLVQVGCQSDVSDEEINKLKKKYNVDDNPKN